MENMINNFEGLHVIKMYSPSNPSELVVEQSVEVTPSAGGLVWITRTGKIAKNSEVQRAVRSHVTARHYQYKKQRKVVNPYRQLVSEASRKATHSSLELCDPKVGHPQAATKSKEYQELVPSRSSLSTQVVRSKLLCPTCLGFLSITKEGLGVEGCYCKRLLHKDSISDSCTTQRDPFFQYPIKVTPQDIKLIDYSI